jgi:hypothetical protein
MKAILIIWLVLIVNIFTSNQQEKRGSVIDIKVPDPSASGDLSSIVKSYDILSLENSPEAYIKNRSRTIFTDSLILIKNESDQSIVIFNNKGKYLKTISKKGRGPEEYLYISDFTFDPKTRVISIYDTDKEKRYSFDGKFISESKLGFRINKVTRLDGSNLILEKVFPSGDHLTDFNIRLVNNDYSTKSARLPIKPLKGPGFGIEGQYIRTLINRDHGYFFSYYGDTIYHIDNKSIKPAYALKYKRDIITCTDGTGEYNTDPDEALRNLSFYELGDINLLYYGFKNSGYCFAFNTSGNKSKLFKAGFVISDCFNDQAFIFIDAMSLEKFIVRNDPEMKKCTNLKELKSILADPEKGFQCFIRINISEL